MSVNQRSRKSTFSSCSRFSASRLASGSLVARALLSTCAIRNLLEKNKSPRRRAPEAPSPRSWVSLHSLATNEDPRRLADIAELGVDRAHRLVSLLRVGDQSAVAVLGRPGELRALERTGDSTAAVAADDSGETVLEHLRARRAGDESGVAHQAASVEGPEDHGTAKLFLC